MIQSIHQGLLAEGIKVPLTKLCAWFGVPRRTVYYRPTKAVPKADPRFAEPIKAMIEQEPSFGYRTVAWLLGFNKNTVQRVFQLKGWQVRKRPIGMRPRIEAVPSVAQAPNERWSTDMCRVWAGRDGWATLALVIDCHTRELLGWHLSRSGKATTAASALEHALITRFGTLGRVTQEFLLRSDNVLAREGNTVLGIRSRGVRANGCLKNSCPGGLRRQEVVSSIANTGSVLLPPSPSSRRDPKSQAEGPNIIYEVASCASTAL